jgi:hypothetical protein
MKAEGGEMMDWAQTFDLEEAALLRSKSAAARGEIIKIGDGRRCEENEEKRMRRMILRRQTHTRSLARSHTRTHARTCTHTRTHTRTRTRTHIHTPVLTVSPHATMVGLRGGRKRARE